MRCQQFYLNSYFAPSNSVFIGGRGVWVYKTKENDTLSPKLSLKNSKWKMKTKTLQIKTVTLHFVSKYFFKMKYLILKFPAYNFMLKNYAFSETTFLSSGISYVVGESGPTGWVYFVLHSAPRATVHVLPLHPSCIHFTFLSEKVNSPCWGSRFSWQININAYVYSSLARQLCAINNAVFCKLSFWLSSALHCLSNPKRILH